MGTGGPWTHIHKDHGIEKGKRMSFQFDASQYDPSSSMEPLPTGWRQVIITGNTVKGVKSGKGGGLMFNLKDTETGRPAMLWLNLWHDNEQAKDIANRELSAIVHVTLGVTQGRLSFSNPSELENIPFYILNQHDNEGRNDFRGFKDNNGNEPKGQNAGQPTGTPSAPASAPPLGQPTATQPQVPAQPPAPEQPQQPGGWAPPGQPPAGQPPAQQPPGQPPAAPWGAPGGNGQPPAQPQQPQQPPAQPGWGNQPPAQPAGGGWTPPGQ